jgi:predicted nucleotidyltransferase
MLLPTMGDGSSAANERQAALRELASRFRLQSIYAFGSRARSALAWLGGAPGSLSPGPSDLDIGVLAQEALGIEAKVSLAQALEDLTGANRVDLVDLRTADPFLAAEVIRGERLLTADGLVADEYDLYVLRRAGDLAHLERERMALVLRERP